MAGATMTPAQPNVPGVAGHHLPQSLMNSYRIAAVAGRLSLHVRGACKGDIPEFFNLCLSLARGIDFAVANDEIPAGAKDLPLLLKQICHRRNECFLQAAIMVLMVSVKNACKIGWFLEKDASELLSLANEIGSGFRSSADINSDQGGSLAVVNQVMFRFYPRLNLGQILTLLEVKPGFGAHVVDFHISKNSPASPQDKIRLFVVQTDNMETSSCLISPPQANFLINGKPVERRTNVSMDIGPQIPTIVTSVLKYGTNLLQAVGQFNGHYMIVVAFMSVKTSLDPSSLQSYVQPVSAATSELDTDMEVVEGASRISLNCPISFTRIGIPIKGRSCKHLQCFDFKNFVEINSRRPNWRCPHCNRSVCYPDICIDQSMWKVLKEVGENVADVIISADGSWQPFLESSNSLEQRHDESKCLQVGPEPLEKTSFSKTPSNVVDLTVEDDEMDSAGTSEIEDRKPFFDMQNHSFNTNLTVLPEPSSAQNTGEINQTCTSLAADNYWAGIYATAYSSAASSAAVVIGISEPSPASNAIPCPLLTDAISPALNQELANGCPTNTFAMDQLPVNGNFQLQESQFGNSLISNEYGRAPPIMGRPYSRTPIAVQALPAQSLTPPPHLRSRAPLSSLATTSSFVASQASSSMVTTADAFTNFGTNMDRQQQLCRLPVSPVQLGRTNSQSLPHHVPAQNWNHRDHPLVSGQSVQQVVGLPAPCQLPGWQNSHQQQSLNRMPHALSQSPNVIRPQLPRTQSQQDGVPAGVGQAAGLGSNQRSQFMADVQQAAHWGQISGQMARQAASVPHQIQAQMRTPFPANSESFRASMGEQRGNMVQPASGVDNYVDLTSEQNWRPTGRMRGSLSAQAFSALSQYIIQPTQSTEATRTTRPLQIPNPQIPPIPEELQAFFANVRSPLH